MTVPLALIEHLQKVLYLLTLFFPVAAFFLFGLILSWMRSRDKRLKLKESLANHQELTKELMELTATSEKLSSKIAKASPRTRDQPKKASIHSQKKEAEHIEMLDIKESRINELESELASLRTQANDLKDQLNERDNRISELENELSESLIETPSTNS